ncbi:Uncharacterised protein [Vibrio cholerae]|nr:Uncharacterised protein [Vibrio cholerae]
MTLFGFVVKAIIDLFFKTFELLFKWCEQTFQTLAVLHIDRGGFVLKHLIG